MNKTQNTITCWLVDADEFAQITAGHPFTPAYKPYLFFGINERREKVVEGHLGNTEKGGDFHDRWDTTLSYFNQYQQKRKQYITFDKINFYEIAEIIPTEPFIFVLKKPGDDLAIMQSAAVSATAHRLHFEELGGEHFERLVFAYVQRLTPAADVQWLGETGKDQGRDILAETSAGSQCFHCANYRELTFTKAKGDIDSLIAHQVLPDALTVVCGGRVPNQLRDKIKAYAGKAGITSISVWSGSELEAKLRENAPDLVKRFFEGVAFPPLPGIVPVQPIPVEPVAELPELIVKLLPNLHFDGDDGELAVFLAEVFYYLGKGQAHAFTISITEEPDITARTAALLKAPKTVMNRNELLLFRKVLDMINQLKAELNEKIRLFAITNLYSARGDDAAMAIIFRELLKLSFMGMLTSEELALGGFTDADFKQVKAQKFQGDKKIAVYKDHSGVIGFNIWLTEAEYKTLRKTMPGTESLSEMDFSFIGFECSDLSRDVLIVKAIPAFIDAIYDYKQRGAIEQSDNHSWNHLHAYHLTTG